MNWGTSDQKLIHACRQGDTQAWTNLLNQYERLVFSIPLRYGLSREDAADITQLTFTILLQSLDRLADDSHLGPWLATVARRHTWRLLKRDKREGVNEAEDLSQSVTLLSQPSSESGERWELLEWLNHGLAQLNERCRNLLLALYFDTEQPSYADTAARFDLPVGSIGPTRARCLERLKQLL
ncbi:MAG: sigma-70 family RNA polymerase sigma factor [Anaerolineae bacterium]